MTGTERNVKGVLVRCWLFPFCEPTASIVLYINFCLPFTHIQVLVKCFLHARHRSRSLGAKEGEWKRDINPYPC